MNRERGRHQARGLGYARTRGREARRRRLNGWDLLEDRTLLDGSIDFASMGSQLGKVFDLGQPSLTKALDAAQTIPILGSKLGDIPWIAGDTGSGTPGALQQFDAIGSTLSNLGTQTDNSALISTIQNALFTLLNPSGGALPLLGRFDGQAITNNNVGPSDIRVEPDIDNDHSLRLTILLHKGVSGSDTQLDFNLGLGNFLTLGANGGVDLTLGADYLLQVTFDPTTGALTLGSGDLSSIDPNLPSTPFAIDLNASLNSFHAEGRLNGLLDATVTDAGNTNIQGAFGVSFDTGGNVNVALSANAHIDLQLSLDFFNGTLPLNPTLGAEFYLDWQFGGDSVDTNDATTFGSISDIGFKDVSFRVDNFFPGFVQGLIQQIQKFTEPLQPIVDFMNKPIPGLDRIGLNISMRDALNLPASADDTLDAINLINHLQITATDAKIDLGSFNLGTDLRTQQASGAALSIQGAAPTAARDLLSQVLHNVSTTDGSIAPLLSGDPNSSDGFQFPFLKDPVNSAFELLLGQNVTFFTYKTSLDQPLNYPLVFGIPGLFDARMNVGLEVRLSLSVGYDSSGLKALVGDISNGNLGTLATDVLDGFYVDNTPPPPGSFAYATGVDLSGQFTAGADVPLVSLTGGIYANVDLHIDPSLNEPDNRIHLNNFTQDLFDRQFGVFTASGKIWVSFALDVGIDVEAFGVGARLSIYHDELAYYEIYDFDQADATTSESPPPDGVIPIVLPVADAETIHVRTYTKSLGNAFPWLVIDPSAYEQGIEVEYPDHIEQYPVADFWHDNGVLVHDDLEHYHLIATQLGLIGFAQIMDVKPVTVIVDNVQGDGEGDPVDAILFGGLSNDVLVYHGAGRCLLVGGGGDNQLVADNPQSAGVEAYGNSIDLPTGTSVEPPPPISAPDWVNSELDSFGGSSPGGTDSLYLQGQQVFAVGGNGSNTLHVAGPDVTVLGGSGTNVVQVARTDTPTSGTTGTIYGSGATTVLLDRNPGKTLGADALAIAPGPFLASGLDINGPQTDLTLQDVQNLSVDAYGGSINVADLSQITATRVLIDNLAGAGGLPTNVTVDTPTDSPNGEVDVTPTKIGSTRITVSPDAAATCDVLGLGSADSLTVDVHEGTVKVADLSQFHTPNLRIDATVHAGTNTTAVSVDTPTGDAEGEIDVSKAGQNAIQILARAAAGQPALGATCDVLGLGPADSLTIDVHEGSVVQSDLSGIPAVPITLDAAVRSTFGLIGVPSPVTFTLSTPVTDTGTYSWISGSAAGGTISLDAGGVQPYITAAGLLPLDEMTVVLDSARSGLNRLVVNASDVSLPIQVVTDAANTGQNDVIILGVSHSVHVDVDGGTSSTTVDVGQGTLTTIQGLVNVSNAAVNVHDENQTVSSVMILDAGSLQGWTAPGFAGYAAPEVTFTNPQAVTVKLGAGDAMNVSATPSATTTIANSTNARDKVAVLGTDDLLVLSGDLAVNLGDRLTPAGAVQSVGTLESLAGRINITFSSGSPAGTAIVADGSHDPPDAVYLLTKEGDGTALLQDSAHALSLNLSGLRPQDLVHLLVTGGQLEVDSPVFGTSFGTLRFDESPRRAVTPPPDFAVSVLAAPGDTVNVNPDGRGGTAIASPFYPQSVDIVGTQAQDSFTVTAQGSEAIRGGGLVSTTTLNVNAATLVGSLSLTDTGPAAIDPSANQYVDIVANLAGLGPRITRAVVAGVAPTMSASIGTGRLGAIQTSVSITNAAVTVNDSQTTSPSLMELKPTTFTGWTPFATRVPLPTLSFANVHGLAIDLGAGDAINVSNTPAATRIANNSSRRDAIAVLKNENPLNLTGDITVNLGARLTPLGAVQSAGTLESLSGRIRIAFNSASPAGTTIVADGSQDPPDASYQLTVDTDGTALLQDSAHILSLNLSGLRPQDLVHLLVTGGQLEVDSPVLGTSFGTLRFDESPRTAVTPPPAFAVSVLAALGDTVNMNPDGRGGTAITSLFYPQSVDIVGTQAQDSFQITATGPELIAQGGSPFTTLNVDASALLGSLDVTDAYAAGNVVNLAGVGPGVTSAVITGIGTTSVSFGTGRLAAIQASVSMTNAAVTVDDSRTSAPNVMRLDAATLTGWTPLTAGVPQPTLSFANVRGTFVVKTGSSDGLDVEDTPATATSLALMGLGTVRGGIDLMGNHVVVNATGNLGLTIGRRLNLDGSTTDVGLTGGVLADIYFHASGGTGPAPLAFDSSNGQYDLRNPDITYGGLYNIADQTDYILNGFMAGPRVYYGTGIAAEVDMPRPTTYGNDLVILATNDAPLTIHAAKLPVQVTPSDTIFLANNQGSVVIDGNGATNTTLGYAYEGLGEIQGDVTVDESSLTVADTHPYANNQNVNATLTGTTLSGIFGGTIHLGTLTQFLNVTTPYVSTTFTVLDTPPGVTTSLALYAANARVLGTTGTLEIHNNPRAYDPLNLPVTVVVGDGHVANFKGDVYLHQNGNRPLIAQVDDSLDAPRNVTVLSPVWVQGPPPWGGFFPDHRFLGLLPATLYIDSSTTLEVDGSPGSHFLFNDSPSGARYFVGRGSTVDVQANEGSNPFTILGAATVNAGTGSIANENQVQVLADPARPNDVTNLVVDASQDAEYDYGNLRLARDPSGLMSIAEFYRGVWSSNYITMLRFAGTTSQLTVSAGANRFASSYGDIVDVEDTGAAGTTIHPNRISVYVAQTDGPLTITRDAAGSISLGGGSTSALNGPVTITDPVGTLPAIPLYLDDSSDATARSIDLGPSAGGTYTVAGLAPAPVVLDPQHVQLNLSAGKGGNTIQATDSAPGAPINLSAGASNDRVTVRLAPTGVSNLTVDGGAGNDQLMIGSLAGSPSYTKTPTPGVPGAGTVGAAYPGGPTLTLAYSNMETVQDLASANSAIQAGVSGVSFNRFTGIQYETLTLTNTSTSDIGDSLLVTLASLPAGAAQLVSVVINGVTVPISYTAAGIPSFVVPGVLRAGQSLKISLGIHNPKLASLALAPQFQSIHTL
jgi:hypothetical protein